MLDRRLKLGTYFGIGLYVHWTFALLIGFFAFQASGGGPVAIAFSIAILIGVFFCVTLHEYGHALAARQFGIPTLDITLLPIGGVARLQNMPRIPWQELVVAVAGPAVNIVIAIILASGMLLVGGIQMLLGSVADPMPVAENTTPFGTPSLFHYVFVLTIINISLVFFNMIPAFPMDGGRVFRSVMAMVMDYRKATKLASRVGLVCAVMMVILVLYTNQPNPYIPILIAVFISFAGLSEARQVDLMESIRGLTVGDAMIRSPRAIPMDLPLSLIAHGWRNTNATAMPILSIVGTVIGVLRLSDVNEALASGVDPNTTAGELIDQSVPVVSSAERLENVIMRVGNRRQQLAVADLDGRLAGILDLDSMMERCQLSRHLPPVPENQFDWSN